MILFREPLPAPRRAYFLDGTLEAFEEAAQATQGRLGFTYPDNEMILVLLVPTSAGATAVECKAGDWVIESGDAFGKCTPEEFEAAFIIVEEEIQ